MDQPNRTVDLLRNHDWNAQALICDLTGQPIADALNRFSVKIEPIKGPAHMPPTTTFFATKKEAYAHARKCLGMDD